LCFAHYDPTTNGVFHCSGDRPRMLDSIDAEYAELYRACVQEKPSKRPSFDTICRKLQVGVMVEKCEVAVRAVDVSPGDKLANSRFWRVGAHTRNLMRGKGPNAIQRPRFSGPNRAEIVKRIHAASALHQLIKKEPCSCAACSALQLVYKFSFPPASARCRVLFHVARQSVEIFISYFVVIS
jgi:hypothetical protein